MSSSHGHLVTGSKPDVKLAESSCPDHHLPDPEPSPGCQLVRLSSLKRVCGAHQRTILAVCGVVLSVWITWIVILHLNTKVKQMSLVVPLDHLIISSFHLGKSSHHSSCVDHTFLWYSSSNNISMNDTLTHLDRPTDWSNFWDKWKHPNHARNRVEVKIRFLLFSPIFVLGHWIMRINKKVWGNLSTK